jgi:hypothetical protein
MMRRVGLASFGRGLGLAMSAFAGLMGLVGCRDAPAEARLGWEPARIALSGTLTPASDGVASALMEVWGARLRLAEAASDAFALEAARPTPKLEAGAFGLSLTLRVPPPCTPAGLRTIAEGLWPALAAPRGAGLHALDPEAAGRVADALRASPEVTDVSTASAHAGLVAVALARSAPLRDLLALATRAAAPASVAVVPAAASRPVTAGGLSRPDVTLAVVTRAPALGPERIAAIEVAPPRDGLVKVSVLVRPEAVGPLAELTGAHLGRHLPILSADGQLLAAPVLATRVRDGRLELRIPHSDQVSAHALAAALGAAVLPAAPTVTRLEAACGTDGPLEPLPAPTEPGDSIP